MNAPDKFRLEATRFIRAPREKVFDAFVTEAGLAAWLAPRGMKIPEAKIDARVGGRWQVTMMSREGTRFVGGGVYREIARPARLSFTWQWEGGPMGGFESLVEVEFTAADGGTQVRLTHSGFPDAGSREGHNQGWTSCLNRLTDLLDERGTAASVTLLGDARSSYMRTARMGLVEKGVAYGHQGVLPHSPEINAVHPFGRVPAFRDGEIALFETSAILKYVDEAFEGPALFPATIIGRARCEQWISAINSYCYYSMVRRYVLAYIFPKGTGGQPDRGVVDGAVKEMPAQLAALDKAYGAGDYLAGGALSAADLFLAPILAYVEMFPEGKKLLSAVPNVQRAQAALRQRKSFKETQP